MVMKEGPNQQEKNPMENGFRECREGVREGPGRSGRRSGQPLLDLLSRPMVIFTRYVSLELEAKCDCLLRCDWKVRR